MKTSGIYIHTGTRSTHAFCLGSVRVASLESRPAAKSAEKELDWARARKEDYFLHEILALGGINSDT